MKSLHGIGRATNYTLLGLCTIIIIHCISILFIKQLGACEKSLGFGYRRLKTDNYSTNALDFGEPLGLHSIKPMTHVQDFGEYRISWQNVFGEKEVTSQQTAINEPFTPGKSHLA
jgi:hypothetical protein